MKFGIVTFPGSNCDYDAYHAVVDGLGEEAFYLWHKDHDLRGSDVIILPGGFSYGDYLRAGAIARFSPIMREVIAHAERGGPVLAICNGYQIACEAGLLDGALTRNASLHFECRDVHLLVEGKPTPFTRGIPAGRVLRIPIAHAEGRFVHPNVDALEKEGRVVFRYVDPTGGTGEGANPNGSVANIAGTCNARGNVVGLMPHPERASEAVLGSDDGKMLFASLLAEMGRRV